MRKIYDSSAGKYKMNKWGKIGSPRNYKDIHVIKLEKDGKDGVISKFLARDGSVQDSPFTRNVMQFRTKSDAEDYIDKIIRACGDIRPDTREMRDQFSKVASEYRLLSSRERDCRGWDHEKIVSTDPSLYHSGRSKKYSANRRIYSDDLIKSIRKEYKSGSINQTSLAKKYNMSICNIHRIVTRKTYDDVD